MNVVNLRSKRPTPRNGQVSVWEYVCALQDAANACDISPEEGELFVYHALLDALEEDAEVAVPQAPIAFAA